MIQDTHVAGNNFIFENCAWWNINAVAMICNNDNGALCEKKNYEGSKVNFLNYVQVRVKDGLLTRKETPRPNVTSPETVK